MYKTRCLHKTRGVHRVCKPWQHHLKTNGTYFSHNFVCCVRQYYVHHKFTTMHYNLQYITTCTNPELSLLDRITAKSSGAVNDPFPPACLNDFFLLSFRIKVNLVNCNTGRIIYLNNIPGVARFFSKIAVYLTSHSQYSSRIFETHPYQIDLSWHFHKEYPFTWLKKIYTYIYIYISFIGL